MNAVDEIQAAIDRLTKLKSRGSDGSWGVHNSSSGTAGITNDVGRGVAHYVPAPDAELIVTLHATIDAQLSILRAGLRWAELDRDGKVPDFAADDELALARAINGGAN